MKCPHCGAPGSTVEYTRPRGEIIRRLRQCAHCRRKYHTQETLVPPPRASAASLPESAAA